MTPRAKIHENAAARLQASRERRRAEGMKQINVWLSGAAAERLDEMAKAQGVDRAAVIESLLMQGEKE